MLVSMSGGQCGPIDSNIGVLGFPGSSQLHTIMVVLVCQPQREPNMLNPVILVVITFTMVRLVKGFTIPRLWTIWFRCWAKG